MRKGREAAKKGERTALCLTEGGKGESTEKARTVISVMTHNEGGTFTTSEAEIAFFMAFSTWLLQTIIMYKV